MRNGASTDEPVCWVGGGLSQDSFHGMTCSKPNDGITAEEAPQLPASAREAKLEYTTFNL